MKKIYNGLYVFDCNLNLEKLKNSCFKVEQAIANFSSQDRIPGQPNPPFTLKVSDQYNFLGYPYPQIHELYRTIQKIFYEAEKTQYGYNLKCNYFVKSWLNIYHPGEFIDWHGHNYGLVRGWHGFFCVDTEPSVTSYDFVEDKHLVDVECKNNTIIIGLSDINKHKTQPWFESDKPRITIAFDVFPEQPTLRKLTSNHLIPI